MARKRGLLGIFLVILLYFVSGVAMVYITNFIDSHLSNDVPFREYIIGGLASVAGFLYWFVILRLGRKSLKKLITGRCRMSWWEEIDEDDLRRMADKLFWKFMYSFEGFKSKKAKEIYSRLTKLDRDVLKGRIDPIDALKELDRLASKVLKEKLPERDKKLLLLAIAESRLEIGADFFEHRIVYMHGKEKRRKKGRGKGKGKKRKK